MLLRQTALALGIAAVVAMWYFAEGAGGVALLVLSAYTFSPWGFLAFGAKSLSDQARAIALGVVVALAVVSSVSVATDDSSTAALVFVFLPAYQWAAIGIVWAVGAGRASNRAQ
jgi:hypothetical protein